MTAKQSILLKPTLAQRIIRARMTKLSIDDPSPDWEAYGSQALQWWDETHQEFEAEAKQPISETQLAEKIIEKLKDDTLWGKLLR